MPVQGAIRPYCTIFNALYLVRGLALYASLARHDPAFRLYVFAMDSTTAQVLRGLGDERVVVITPDEFEDEDLRRVKPSRSLAEYFWTCTPAIIHHCLAARHEAECTYVDADVWLLHDPQPLFDEMGTAAVLLTDHRFTGRHEQSASHGRYCVQFMRFVANAEGMKALTWWRARCIEWCFAREEDGKFGDQKYLDDWPTRFAGVHVLRHAGGGVAPWNVGRLEFERQENALRVRDGSGASEPVVFYHFHGLKTYGPNTACYGYGYHLPHIVKDMVYRPYVRELHRLFRRYGGQLTGLAATSPAAASSSNANALGRLARFVWGLPNTHRIPGAD